MRQVHPVWINLEYLSAEAWIESCHGLPSQRPDGLVKHFYFPGFTPATGGLLREPGLSAERDALQASPEQQESVLRALGVPQHALSRRRDGARLVSLFCYPDAPVDALASALAADPRPTVLLAPEGVAPGLKRPAPRRAARPGQAALRQPAGLRPPAVVRRPELRARRGFLRAGRLGRASAGLADLPAARPGPSGQARGLAGPLSRHRRRPGVDPSLEPARRPQALGPSLAAALAPEAWQAWARPPVTGTQPRPIGPIWRKIWPRFAQSWPRNARIESFLRSPDAIGPQNTDASRVCTRSKTRVKSRIRPPDDGDGGPGSTRR